MIASSGPPVLQVIDYGRGQTSVLSIDPVLGVIPQSVTPHGPVRIALDLGVTAGSILPGALDQALGGADDLFTYLMPGTAYSYATVLVSAQVDGNDFLFASASAFSGVSVFDVAPDTSLTANSTVADTNESYASGVSAMAVVQTALKTFLFTGSALEHGISGYRVAADGALTKVESYGRSESLPVQTITALEHVSIGGKPYLLAASAGSSSLTVLEVSEAGILTATDHIIDSLDTRFAGVTALEVVEASGRVFVLAAGSDSGLSLFMLTGAGQLVHLQSIEDTAAISLDGVSGLSATQTGDQLRVFVTAGGEAGLSVFSVDLSQAGVVQSVASGTLNGGGLDDVLTLETGSGSIFAGAGDDMLLDGAGSDLLEGGSGADMFIIGADAVSDVIADYEIGQDRVVLSGWSMLYYPGQLGYSLTPEGYITLSHGTEELEIRQSGGAAFTESDFASLNLSIQGRTDVVRTPLQSDVPDPGPPPDPGIIGTPLNDILTGTSGDDMIDGLAGHDRLDGLDGDDTIYGRAGNDALLGRGGNDTIFGGDGDDNIAASDGHDTVYGGAGDDSLGGGAGNDFLYGEGGNDVIGGGPGHDLIGGGAGNDVTSGGWGRDVVYGGAGNDTMAGSFDADEVYGEAGDDTLGGGAGNDKIWGGAGDDSIGAGDDDDFLWGGTGHDFLAGGNGDDTLLGEQGNDGLNGGSGSDILTGGSGGDEFIFSSLTLGEVDVITDFEDGYDLIRIHGIDAAGMQGRLNALTPTDTHDGVELTYGGHLILLRDVFVDTLGVEDFIFI